jgi:YbbR domain-containing protein
MDKAARTRWLTRAASLAFAVILWYFVTWDGTALSTRELTVPLRYQGLRDGYSLSNTVQSVSIRLEGRLEALALLNRGDITASVEMSDLRPGKYRLPIQLAAPSGTRVVSYSPNVVDFELFRIIERTLRLSLALQDQMPDNLSLASVDIAPPEIIVKGPEASVMAVRRAEVRSAVADMTGGEIDLRVYLVGDAGDLTDLITEPGSVRVNARFSRAMREIRVPIRVQVTGVPGNGMEIGNVTVSPDHVTLRGTMEALAGIEEISPGPVDVSGHAEDMNVDIPLEPPSPGISIIGADHVGLAVEFRSSVENRTFTGVPIALVGTENAQEWTISPPAASVTVEWAGEAGQAFDLSSPPVELYVDATNVVASRMALPVLVRNAERGVNIIRIEPQQVTITEAFP